MGAVSCRWRASWRRCHAAALLAAVLFASAMVVAAGRPIRLPAAALARRRIDSATAMTTTASRAATTTWWTDAAAAALSYSRRRWLVGPGSSPPTCRARCTLCRATRVAIQPGVGPQWEYYPEVWRCKCGNTLFMP